VCERVKTGWIVPSKIVGFSKLVVGKGNSGCGGRLEKLSRAGHLTVFTRK
jgi:hypothetical protein